MRNLFLTLLLVNLAFAAWHSWFAAPPPVPVARDADVPSIRLVSELEEGAAAEPDEVEDEPSSIDIQIIEPPVARIPAPIERCISIGPFRELSQAATAAANLRSAGYEPTQRVGEGEIWIGYWVHIPRIPTRERANEMLAALQANGISDAYAVPGDEGQIISLGVFSEITRAGRRREAARALGFEPLIVDQNRRGTVYWVDVTLSGPQALDMEALQTPGRIIRLEQRDCASVRS